MRDRLPTIDVLTIPAETGRLILGLSGGVDSIALLHALASNAEARARGLHAIHVHHGLHADADRWQSHCETACATLGVPLTRAHVTVTIHGDGLENAARRARHAAFADVLQPGDILVLAHHRDDQAETFLLRALRGSGVDGLGAMAAWRSFGDAWLWRPWLDVPRSAIVDYARRHALDWIDDPSNADTTLDRNYLRHTLMPHLRERWPHAHAALAQSATHAREASALLTTDDRIALAACSTDRADTLSIDALGQHPPSRRARVLRLWIASLALPPLPAEGARRVEADVLGARPDAEARFDWHGATLRAWCGLLHAARIAPPLDASLDLAWDGRTPIVLPDGGRLAIEPMASLPPGTRIRARRGGERIRLPGRTHRHALKHVLQDRRIPPWTRAHLPLLVDGDDVLSAGDIVLSARLADLLGDACVVWTRPPGA